MYACSHSILVDEGWCCFNSMSRDYGLKTEMEHYACMINLLGCSGNLNEIECFIKNKSYIPNTTLWGALLSAYRLHSNMDLLKTTTEDIFHLEPQNTANYVLL